MSRYWYAFNSVGDPFSPTSYRKITSTPGCINGPLICAVYAQGSTYPIGFSNNILQYISNGLANNIAEPALPVGSKFFVYLKGTAI